MFAAMPAASKLQWKMSKDANGDAEGASQGLLQAAKWMPIDAQQRWHHLCQEVVASIQRGRGVEAQKL